MRRTYRGSQDGAGVRATAAVYGPQELDQPVVQVGSHQPSVRPLIRAVADKASITQGKRGYRTTNMKRREAGNERSVDHEACSLTLDLVRKGKGDWAATSQI